MLLTAEDLHRLTAFLLPVENNQLPDNYRQPVYQLPMKRSLSHFALQIIPFRLYLVSPNERLPTLIVYFDDWWRCSIHNSTVVLYPGRLLTTAESRLAT